MDILLFGIGLVLVIFGAKQKGSDGTRTGGGLAMLISGGVLLGIGVIYFVLAFMVGFASAQ